MMDGAEERSGVMDFLIFVRERQAESEEVRVKAEEAWLTAKAVGTLLGADSTAVERQFRSLFATGELLERDVSARFLRMRKDGSKNEETFYSAAAVIALGLRMETPQARQFRRWAWDKLSNYAVKGWVLDKERLKGDRLFDAAYFEHLKSELAEIRASTRRFDQRLTDLFATSADYSKDSPITQGFYAAVIERLHGVARSDLNDVLCRYLDYAVHQAERQVPMLMTDWASKLSVCLQWSDDELREARPMVMATIDAVLKDVAAEDMHDEAAAVSDMGRLEELCR